MPRLCSMTWVASQKRWTKQYYGRTYSVSCRQLQAGDTKDASWAAANRWWEAKRAELDAERKAAEPPPDATSQVVAGLLATHGFAHIGDLMLARDRGEAANRLLVLLREAGEQEGATSALEGVLAGRPVLAEMPAEQVEQLDAMLGPTPGPAPAGRSLQEHADRWIASLRDRVAARKMSPGRRNRYEQDIRRFLEWSGPGSRVDELTPAKMDGWYTHLCGIVEEGGSTETARHAIMTVRQLVTWLAERGTIPLPGNIRSRCHTFGQVTKENEHFSRDEIRAILQAADASSRRTKLYLLLMLNCGMYQADISDLRKDELDETAGTITRRRSKRRHQADAPKICYSLWPETLSLLVEFRAAEGDRVFLTEDGNPLVRGEYAEAGTTGADEGEEKYQRYDTIRSSIERLKEKVLIRLPPKHFRKTSAQLLFENAKYRHLHQIFLAQAPRGVAARNYLNESRSPDFRKAVMWLGEQYLVEA